MRQDAAEFVAESLAARQKGTVFVLFHSIMWQYLPEATRQTIIGLIADAGRSATRHAPIAWLRMEPVELSDATASLQLDLYPGSGQTRLLARCDYHGRSIEWLNA